MLEAVQQVLSSAKAIRQKYLQKYFLHCQVCLAEQAHQHSISNTQGLADCHDLKLS